MSEPPELVGVTEVATLLGLPSADSIVRTKGFPAPAAVLALGRVWYRDDVARWDREGRPTTNMQQYVGITEIARVIGVSESRVRQLLDEDPTFPRPVATLAAGRVWSHPTIIDWDRSRTRRPGGRPRKATS